jgi:hypothetical protein
MNIGFESDLEQFLRDYPGISLSPSRSEAEVILKGKFSFQAKVDDGPEITDSFYLEIRVPSNFPKALPKVIETNNKIPRDGKHHVNPDGTLCLGSPLRLLSLISKNPTIVGFSENCIVPFLYAISNNLSYGGKFIFGELTHGKDGIIDDYLELFELNRPDQVIKVLKCLSKERKIAEKKQCPCGCGQKLKKCSYNKIITQYRRLAPRSWFKKQADGFKD